jgi:hypothetical protein
MGDFSMHVVVGFFIQILFHEHDNTFAVTTTTLPGINFEMVDFPPLLKTYPNDGSMPARSARPG